MVTHVSLSGLCVGVEAQHLQAKGQHYGSSSATPAVGSSHAEARGSTSSGDAAWRGSGGRVAARPADLAMGAVVE